MKITYLFGAGASANALPIVKELSDSFNYMVKIITDIIDCNNSTFTFLENDAKIIKDFLIFLIDNLKNLAKKNYEFGTIDTYAKFLFNTNQIKELNELKKTLSIYFILHQLIFKNHISISRDSPLSAFEEIDRRYLTLIVSLMSGREFPSDVKFLTWNYDFQIQLASYYFKPEGFESSDNHSYKLGPPLINYYPNLGPKHRDTNYSIYHINGIAGFVIFPELSEFNCSIFNTYLKDKENISKNIFSKIKSFMKDSYLLFDFAWEKQNIFDNIRDKSSKNDYINHLKESQVLIIVGYSFPFFNREIDKQILTYFSDNNNKSNLNKTIYYQSPSNDGEKLYSQFNLDKNKIEIINRPNVDNFFIPHDY